VVVVVSLRQCLLCLGPILQSSLQITDIIVGCCQHRARHKGGLGMCPSKSLVSHTVYTWYALLALT
jgi:hypothetical protein